MQEFHIHADLQENCPRLEEFLLEKGAYSDPFLHCEGVVSHAPLHHYTFRIHDREVFRGTWAAIEDFLERERPEWNGYFEAEVIVGGNTTFSDRPFNPEVPVPFALSLKALLPGVFRRNELHIYFHEVDTDERLKDTMTRIGFYPAQCNSDGVVEGIWTIQAESVGEIKAIRHAITEYLSQAGGTVNGYLHEEQVVDFRLSHPDVKRAPVIDAIHWQY